MAKRENNIKPCECGSIEFVTEPNQYDIYKIIEGVLFLIEAVDTHEVTKLFCRECGKELKGVVV